MACPRPAPPPLAPPPAVGRVADPPGDAAAILASQIAKVVSDQISPLPGQVHELADLLRAQFAGWLSIDRAAQFCDCSYDIIYRAVQAGEPPASDIRNGERKACPRITRADLNAWLERKKGGKLLPPPSELNSKKSRYLPGVP